MECRSHWWALMTWTTGWLLVLGTCAPAPAEHGGTSSSAPGVGPPLLVNRIWVSSEAASAPGTMRIFLSDGTLLMDSCWETYRLAKWRALEGQKLAWEEDGIPIEAQVAELEGDRLHLRVQVRHATKDEAYRIAASPYVCPDMPKQSAADNPYEVAGVDDPATVPRFLQQLQKAVGAGDAKAVAELARFPLPVSVGGVRKRVASATELESLYPEMFTACLKRVVAAATPQELFANWQGIMFGDGAVWFGPGAGGMRLIAINGPQEGEKLCAAPLRSVHRAVALH
jgi:hypothetical protein